MSKKIVRKIEKNIFSKRHFEKKSFKEKNCGIKTKKIIEKKNVKKKIEEKCCEKNEKKKVCGNNFLRAKKSETIFLNTFISFYTQFHNLFTIVPLFVVFYW